MLRNVVIFLAGAEFFHTLTHIFLALYVKLPLDFTFMSLTTRANIFAIVVNGIITLLLLWWAYKLG